jgi:mannose/fructose/N-acetylgalactosamine-specific phosphotransferase system component IIB
LVNGATIQGTSSGEHQLNIAVKNKDLKMVKILTNNGVYGTQYYNATKFFIDENTANPVNLAVQFNDIKMVKVLMADDQWIQGKKTINIDIAVENRNKGIAKFLLENGVKITHRSLRIAKANEDEDMVKLLLDNGAKEDDYDLL